MKKRAQSGNIRLHFKNSSGFGTISLLIIMAMLITITAGIAGITGLLTRSAQALKAETEAMVQCQSIFTYVDIAVEEEIRRIFDETMDKCIQNAEARDEEADEESAEQVTETDENQDATIGSYLAEEAFQQDFLQEFEKSFKSLGEGGANGKGTKTMTTLNEMLYHKESKLNTLVGGQYRTYEVDIYQYAETLNQYRTYPAKIGNAIIPLNTVNDFALNLDVGFEISKKEYITFQKSYYLNLDQFLQTENLQIEEAVIHGRMQFYKAK